MCLKITHMPLIKIALSVFSNFQLDEDCLMSEPQDLLPPLPLPPPPPPPPGGLPPVPPGLPPLPPGLPPGVPPPLPPVAPPVMSSDLIPQAKAMSQALPVASSLSASTSATTQAVPPEQAIAPVSLSLSTVNKKKLKGGLTLVFGADSDSLEDESMEEKRASLVRYQKMLGKTIKG